MSDQLPPPRPSSPFPPLLPTSRREPKCIVDFESEVDPTPDGESGAPPKPVRRGLPPNEFSLPIHIVVDQMAQALVKGEAAYFLGSGASKPSGLPDWLELMRQVASPLGIVVDKFDDLALVAQHCVNIEGGNRGPLVGGVRKLLSISAEKANRYHQAIALTNLQTLWTTNLDTVLEDSLRDRRIEVRTSDSDLTRESPAFDMEIIKLHGCIARSAHDELVLTREDYEDFAIRRPATVQRLRHDLLNKTILFVGYSYRDPDIQTVVVEARRLAGRATRGHYLVLEREKELKEARRQELWLLDLRRIGIRSVLVDAWSELEDALESLALKSRGRCVFVTGGHTGDEVLATEVGQALASIDGLILIDGQSEGIGRLAANGFGLAALSQRSNLTSRIRYFPNPYAFDARMADDPSLLGTLRSLRTPLLRAAQAVVVFEGGMGTQLEVQLAREAGCVIVPVPTGKGNFVSSLLNDAVVARRLDPEYIRAAMNGTVTANAVAEEVRRSLS